jgi:hypothetical protein
MDIFFINFSKILIKFKKKVSQFMIMISIGGWCGFITDFIKPEKYGVFSGFLSSAFLLG